MQVVVWINDILKNANELTNIHNLSKKCTTHDLIMLYHQTKFDIH